MGEAERLSCDATCSWGGRVLRSLFSIRSQLEGGSLLKDRERSTDLNVLLPGMKPQESEGLEEVIGEGGGARLRFFRTGGEKRGAARGAEEEEVEEEEEEEEEKLEEGVTAAVRRDGGEDRGNLGDLTLQTFVIKPVSSSIASAALQPRFERNSATA